MSQKGKGTEAIARVSKKLTSSNSYNGTVRGNNSRKSLDYHIEDSEVSGKETDILQPLLSSQE